jgi:hypothetical protein
MTSIDTRSRRQLRSAASSHERNEVLKLIGKAPRGALYTVTLLAVGCSLAACGSASSSSTSGSAGASTTSGTSTATAAAGGGAGGGANPARRAALVACLKQHGVTLPSRPPGSGGAAGGGTGTGTNGTGTTRRRGFLFGGGGAFANNPKLQAAFKACGANFRARGGFRGRLSHAAITNYVTCVRQHGYNLPNPNFSGKGPIFPANIQTNAKFQTASKACQSLLVPPRPNGSSSGTSTSSGA